MTDVSYPLAFIGGLLSFLSPCVLPLVPSYVSYITGISFEDLTKRDNASRFKFITVVNSLFFILGFSAVFMLLGMSSSYLGNLLFKYQESIRIVGGIMIIIFGLFVAGVLNINFLMREAKLHMGGKPIGYFGTFLVGVVFAAGWTPCISPILGSILLYASSRASALFGVKLLSVYSLGLAIPFFISAVVINFFLGFYKKISKFMEVISLESGLLLVVVGVLILTNYMRAASSALSEKLPAFANIDKSLAHYPTVIQLLLALGITAIIACLMMVFFTLIGFWLWAILDCKRRKFKESSEKMAWLVVTILGFIPGAAIYFIVMARQSKRSDSL